MQICVLITLIVVLVMSYPVQDNIKDHEKICKIKNHLEFKDDKQLVIHDQRSSQKVALTPSHEIHSPGQRSEDEANSILINVISSKTIVAVAIHNAVVSI